MDEHGNKKVIIYEKPGFIQVSYEAEENFILFNWESFAVTLNEIQEIYEKALAKAQQNDCYYYIAETSKVRTALSPEIIKWWGSVWVPKLEAAGLRVIVTIAPTTAESGLSTREWQAKIQKGILMKNVDTMEDARAFIKDVQKILKNE